MLRRRRERRGRVPGEYLAKAMLELRSDALPPSVPERRGLVTELRRGAGLAAVAVLIAAPAAGLAGYALGTEVEDRRSDRAEETLAAQRDYYRSSLAAARETWRDRDVCAASLEAAGTPTRDGVLGLFPSPQLKECYAGQEYRAARYAAQAEGERDGE